jgi:UDPglucose--hexose-1-phosphate uridylyltransferase
MNLILRNNRCDEKYPDGIFHAHREYHNIKQEGIGLIEAMGLFILPPRLKKEMSYIDELLSNDDEVEKYFKKYPELIIHKEMIENLISTYGRCLTKEVRNSVIKDYIADTCKNILLNTAVFKNNVEGQKAFIEFVEEVIHDFKD